MAVIRYGPVVGAASGAVGGVVLVATRGGAVMRKRPAVRTRDSAAALAARGMPGKVGAAWNALDETTRAQWVTAAAGKLFPNRLGVLRSISGFQLYSKFVMDIYLGQAPAALAPPTVSNIYSPVRVTAYFLEDGPYVVTTSGLPIPGTLPVEFGFLQSLRRSSQTTGFNRYRRLGSWTRGRGSEDVFPLAEDAGIELWSGVPFAFSVAWQTSGGYMGQRVWGIGTVDAVPFLVTDFETGGLTDWTVLSGSWSISTVVFHAGAASLSCSIGAVPTFVAQIRSLYTLPVYPVRGHVFQYWARWGAGISSTRMLFGFQDASNTYSAVFSSGGVLAIRRVLAGASIDVCSVACPALTNDVWYRCEVSWGSGGTMAVTLYDTGGSVLATASGSNTQYDRGGVGFLLVNVNNTACVGYWDDVTITGRA